MDRREFLKVTGAGALTLFLSGCGINAVSGDKKAGAAPAAGNAEAKPGSVSNRKPLKIVVLCGSPHKAGTSALLAIDRYVNFLVSFVIPFGLLFEMPLIAAALARTGLIHAETLRQGRRFAVLISFIVSALLTPPDVMSQVMMAIPSILLFECSIRCAAWAERSCKQETATLTVNG